MDALVELFENAVLRYWVIYPIAQA